MPYKSNIDAKMENVIPLPLDDVLMPSKHLTWPCAYREC